jgi:ABC-type phosphate transport system substrate-binding protein
VGYVALPKSEAGAEAVKQYLRQSSDYTCPPDGTAMSILGSSTVFPLAAAWKNAFGSHCPTTSISLAGGGSSNGARAACGANSLEADIGGMSRDWRSSEGAFLSSPARLAAA